MSTRLALALPLLLAACGGGDATPDAAAPPLVFGGDRPTELQVPGQLDDGVSYPLVLILHGHGVTGFIQQAYLRMADLSADADVFVLAPDGLQAPDGHNAWNAESGCCDHAEGVDDVAYLGGLIDDVLAAWPIDPAQVYVVGHSNGSFMAYRLACERADVIAGIAGLAGASTSLGATDDCDPSAAVSVLHLHGTLDDIIPIDGGDFGQGAFPGAVGSVSQWQDHNGCDATRAAGDVLDIERDIDGAETTTELADGCPTGVDVELWSIVGGNHFPDFQLDFGTTVLTWLTAHPRP